MPELLTQPAVQFGAAPFIVALSVAVLGRTMQLSGLAVGAGFALSVWLVMGVRLLPLNVPRQIILATLAACVAGFVLDFIKAHPARTRRIIAVAAGLLFIWMFNPALSELEAFVAWGAGIGLVFYCVVVATTLDALHHRPVNAAVGAFTLCLGIGAAGIVGASPLLGRLGFAVAAGSGAVLLVQMLTGRAWVIGRSFTLPVAIFAGLTSAHAVLFGILPWFCLVPLIAAPLLAGTAIAQHQTVWLRAIVLTIAAMAFSAAAVFIAWRELGSMPL